MDENLLIRRRRLLAVFILPALFIIFGMASWLSVNTIWVEMPLLAPVLPEAWSLPAYVSIIIPCGNIGPLAMILLRNKTRYAPFIYLILSLLIGANLTMAFAYRTVVPVGGADHSLAFLICVLVVALCDCTSNVTFLPYLADFNPWYLVYFFVGQGMGGLMPSVLGLIQGSGSFICVFPNETNSTSITPHPIYSEARFDFHVLVLVTVGLLCASLCSFTLIEITLRHLKAKAIEEARKPQSKYLMPISDIIRVPEDVAVSKTPTTKKPATEEHVTSFDRKKEESQERSDELFNSESQPLITHRSGGSHHSRHSVHVGASYSGFDYVSSREARLPVPDQAAPSNETVSVSEFIPFYCLNGFLCLLTNGFLPSVQLFSALPYGQVTYSLVACLWVAAVPIASWMTMCIRVEKFRLLVAIFSVGVLTTVYGLTLAFLCPTVPLQHDAGGSFLIVLAWFLTDAIFSYTRVCVAQCVRRGGHKALFWFGLTTQGASMLSGITAFLMGPVFHAFRDPQLC